MENSGAVCNVLCSVVVESVLVLVDWNLCIMYHMFLWWLRYETRVAIQFSCNSAATAAPHVSASKRLAWQFCSPSIHYVSQITSIDNYGDSNTEKNLEIWKAKQSEFEKCWPIKKRIFLHTCYTYYPREHGIYMLLLLDFFAVLLVAL